MLCLAVWTAIAIPAPQGLIEEAIERGVYFAAKSEIEQERGFGGGRFRQNDNYDNYGGVYGSGYDYYG